MKIQHFLEHHGVRTNPFADEDAQTDPVFRDHCIDSTYHPGWDKIYGNPAQPATAVVFGEKGSGKTALRLQVVRHVAEYNGRNPGQRLYVVEYDDFNAYLDRFADRLSPRKRKAGRLLAEWKLWDHMDALLSLAVTGLIDRILDVRHPAGPAANAVTAAEARLLDRHQVRDLLLLAACYDQSTAETFEGRWHRLRRTLRFRTWTTFWDRALAVGVTVLAIAGILYWEKHNWLVSPWPYVVVAAAWLPWLFRCWKWHWRARQVVSHLRVGNRQVGPLRHVLMRFAARDLSGQPFPIKRRTDDRYELLLKLQGILKTLGFTGLLVVVDRVDEPHLINGSAEQMKALLWPMLDNKFLTQPGIGFKLLLPIELKPYVDRAGRDFNQRARLDKQNLIPSLEWTAEALMDVANARIRACAADGEAPALRNLFDESVTETKLMDALRSLRVPRHLFRFMYRLLVAHASAHTEEDPSWKISDATFESTLALYRREQEAIDRGGE